MRKEKNHEKGIKMRNANPKRREVTWKKMFIPLLLSLGLFSVGCAKKKEMKFEGDHSPYFAKSDFEGKTFHFVRGVEDIDSTSTVGVSLGQSQDFGLVKVEIHEKEIRFIQIFNPQVRDETSKIVAAFPIDHFDMQRERNDYGEQTNRIIEDTKQPWQNRKHIRIDWSAPSNQGSFGTLVWGPPGQIANIETIEVPAKDETGFVSLLQEVTFSETSLWVKWFGLDAGHQDTYRAKVRTYLMPYKKTDFKPLNYTAKDFQRYGYFFTQQNFEDPYRGLLDTSIQRKANIFNVCESGGKGSCAKNKIVWHLNKGFDDTYLATARKVISEWNEVFKKALNRSDDVVVLDESLRVNPHDPRYNIFNYYAPNSGGLGVANWVANPITGEIVAAKATIFGDGIRGQMAYIDQLIDLLANEEEYRKNIEALVKMSPNIEKSESIRQGTLIEHVKSLKELSGTPGTGPLAVASISGRTSMATGLTQIAQQATQLHAMGDQKLNVVKKDPALFQLPDFKLTSTVGSETSGILNPSSFFIAGEHGEKTAKTLLNITSKIEGLKLNGLESALIYAEQAKLEKQILVNQAATGVHSSDFVDSATSSYLMSFIKENGVKELINRREEIKRDVAKNIFYTTMLHEMGHAFGLRHNFAGSSDVHNYHPAFKKAIEGVTAGDKSIGLDDIEGAMTSSVMDYPEHFHLAGSGLGPYDFAAIRYAYNNSIDKDRDQIVARKYKFCTDHQVGESLLCQRWDTGYTVSQVIDNAIESYEERYLMSSIRRDRANFNYYANGQMMMMIRQMLNIRKASDELIYGLISKGDFISKAIEAGEILDINNSALLEQFGIDPTEPGEVFAALLNPNGSGFLKRPTQYQPEGFGDLLYATLRATSFFKRILGTADPGQYLLTQGPAGEANLVQLVSAPKEQALAHYAQQNQVEDVEAFVKANMGRVVNIGVGEYARIYSSIGEDDGFGFKIQALGSIREKIAAMVALGVRDMGVIKYNLASMSGNPYTYPFTKPMIYDLFGKLILDDTYINTFPVRMSNGQTIYANLPAATSIDTRIMSTLFAVTDMVLPGQEESMLDSLRVCAESKSECKAYFGTAQASFVSSSGQDVFTASQNLSNNALGYKLVQSAAEIAEERDGFVKALQTAEQFYASIPEGLAQLKTSRDVLDQHLQNYPQLEKLRTLLTADIPPTENGPQFSFWGGLSAIGGEVQGAGVVTISQAFSNLSQMMNQLNMEASVELTKLEKTLGIIVEPLKEGEKPSETALNLKALRFKVKIDPSFNGQGMIDDGPGQIPSQIKLDDRRMKLVEMRSALVDFLVKSNEFMNSAMMIKSAPIMAKRLNDEIVRKEQSIKLIRRMISLTGGE